MYTAQNNHTEAQRYRLVDPDDDSVYASPQNFNDNAINVCMESAYAFVTKVTRVLLSNQLAVCVWIYRTLSLLPTP